MNEPAPHPAPVIVFDTDCVLCSAWVQFFLKHERDQATRFVSAWSGEGARLADAHGLAPADLDLTFLVVENGRALTRSDAALTLARHLRLPWRALRIVKLLPRRLRDAIYDRIARNRYRWFGHKPHCFIAPPEARSRFVDGTRAGQTTSG